YEIQFIASELAEIQQQLEKKKAEEDAKKMRQALLASEAGDSGDSEPSMLGNQIDDDPVSIQTIQDEERKITIEGYVFDAEVKPLRSGRTLLQIKVTDYTDSLTVKMFSRNLNEAALFENIKKGQWVKVRGSV